MSSRPRNFVLLIGAARAVPYPISPNPTQDISEPNARISAADGDGAGYFQLVALPPSPTADPAHLVTPVTPSSAADPADMVTPVDPSSYSITCYELTEITPVPVSSSSPRTIITVGSAPPTSTTEAQIPPLPTSSSAAIPINTISITDWATVTLPGPPPNGSGSVAVPIAVSPVQYSSSASRRPDLPGGVLGGPAPNTHDLDEAQPKE